ncbi:transposase (plasmid) [Streptomyces longwoodensis]|nr:transposase [Streptomyces longwoodensis]
MWDRIEPLMPADPVRGRRWADHRRTLEAIAWKYRTNSPWRDLPKELGSFIRIAGSRWAVEECFQTAKQECGLDDYLVRRYPGWHRHMTLAMAAQACLTVLRARQLDTDKAETDPPSSSTSASPRSDD